MLQPAVNTEFIILFSIFLPLAAAFLSATIRRPNVREGFTLLFGCFLIYCVWNIYTLAARGLVPPMELVEIFPGLGLRFDIDPLGILFALVASSLWVVTTLYAIGYMRNNNEKNHGRFFAFFAIAISATMGIAFSGNLLTLFLFYEILTLSTFPLVTHHGTEEAKKSGRVYLGVLLTSSIGFFLPAILWTWHATGTTDFRVGGILSQAGLSSWMVGVLLLLFIYGIGKVAVMPMHKWLPAAMVAPTPVSALLHAVAVVKAGAFTVIKVVVYIFGVDYLQILVDINWWSAGWLPWLGSATILTASILALMQDSLKKRLAYSTISQLSYVVLSVGMLNVMSVTAGIFHIAAHAYAKITLFFAAGAIYTASGKKYISQLSGIGRQMPWTMAAFTIGVLSMIGLPPAAGLITKFYMMQGAHAYSEYFTMLLIISTMLNAAYFLPIVFKAYFGESTKNEKVHGEAPRIMLLAMAISAGGTVALFVFPDFVLWLAGLVAQAR